MLFGEMSQFVASCRDLSAFDLPKSIEISDRACHPERSDVANLPLSPPLLKGGGGGIIMEVAALCSIARDNKKISDFLILSKVSGHPFIDRAGELS